MTLRTRLALVVAVVVALSIASASATVYFLVSAELHNQVDASLVTSSNEIAAIRFGPPQATAIPNVSVLTDPRNSLSLDNLSFRLVYQDGTQFYPFVPSPLLQGLAVTPALETQARRGTSPTYSDETIGDTTYRIRTARYAAGTVIQVAASTANVESELSKIKRWLAVVAAGGIGLAALAGYLVARAALGPVRRLSETAERVRQTQDLSLRINVRGGDELSSLASTFNAMLASLDEGSKRQRQLVQDASHELRTPLTSLRTNIEVLSSSVSMSAEDRQQLLDDVVAQVAEMTDLIAELTQLARGEAAPDEMSDVRFDLIVEDAIRRTERNHPSLQVDAELQPTSMVGLPEGLERAVGNLLDNAAKWTPTGQQIEVRLVDGLLTVRDHGPGIADEDLPHIFDRFYRATSARSMAGSGLGLAIVKQVADNHGATISAGTAPDGGTIMRLRFPTSTLAETHSESPAVL